MNHYQGYERHSPKFCRDILKFTNFKSARVEPARVNSHQEQYQVNGMGYASASEAACAVLMERYIPFFKIIPGKTYQVEIGKSSRGDACHADFQIHGSSIFEFHPPRFWMKGRRLGEFSSQQERSEYYRRFNRSKGEERRQIKREMIEQLALNYYLKRRALLDQSSEHNHKNLIVAKDVSDFYQKVIVQFGENLPSEQNFVRQFESVRRDIYRHMKISRNKRDQNPGPGGASLDRKKAA